MKNFVLALLGSQLVLASCAQPQGETLESCRARFADGAEVLDFLEREKFGARYSYRLTGESAASEFRDKSNSASLPENESYQFSTENGYLHIIERPIAAADDIIEVGCRMSSDERMLISISRGANTQEPQQ